MSKGYGVVIERDPWLDDAKREIAELKAQIEAMTPDWKLGGLVRRMPEYTMLRHMQRHKWQYWDYVYDGDPFNEAMIPEAALREAPGEEQDGL